jgi:predicted ATPase
MYLDKISVKNFRTYRLAEVELLHPGRAAQELQQRFGLAVLYPNINLVLGNNGMGKSALLKAIALACLGPAVGDAGIFPYRFVRREPGVADVSRDARRRMSLSLPTVKAAPQATIEADFVPHDQDGVRPSIKLIRSAIGIERKGDLESLSFREPPGKEWSRIFSDDSDAFFCAGYGANRRTEQREHFDRASRRRASSARALRLRSLFEDESTLVPLAAWLPELAATNKGRHTQVVELIRTITGQGHYEFTGELEKDEYLFRKDEQVVPFPALSDGYRAFFGWVGDLLYHVVKTAPSGKKLTENQGMILIDEIDLHLHPSWQMEVLPRLSAALPNIQFIVTSHSPLVVGSLQWVNLIVLSPAELQSSKLERKAIPIHGLDADQVLVTPFFDLGTTRAHSRGQVMRDLRDRARTGDKEAAVQLMEAMSRGDEGTPDAPPPNIRAAASPQVARRPKAAKKQPARPLRAASKAKKKRGKKA